MEKGKKLRIKLKGYDATLVDLACSQILEVANRFNATVSGPVPLPTKREVITILRAVHRYKDSREQFEMRTHKRLIDIFVTNDELVKALTSLELPTSVDIAMKV